MNIREKLSGTGVAVVTPFTSNGQVDFPSLEKLLDFLVSGGVDYVVMMGTTGEAPVLSPQEKHKILDCAIRQIAGKVPVVLGLGGNDTAKVIAELNAYPMDSIAAILSVSPYYNKPSQEGLFQHYKAVGQASPRPVILYNVPARTGRNIEVDTVLRLASEVDNIKGIKEASSNMLQCMEILKQRPSDFLVVSGDDALALPQMLCGMDGVISVAANCMPIAFSMMVTAARQGQLDKARLLNESMMPAYDLLFEENNPAGVKTFLSVLGLMENTLRLPLVPVSDRLQEKIKNFILSAKSSLFNHCVSQ